MPFCHIAPHPKGCLHDSSNPRRSYRLHPAIAQRQRPAHEAHVHGVGQLDVALDGNTLSLHLDSPLANLVGFEHAANSAKDKQAVRAMSADLRAAGKLFVTSPAATCNLTAVSLYAGSIDPLLLGEKLPPMPRHPAMPRLTAMPISMPTSRFVASTRSNCARLTSTCSSASADFNALRYKS